MFPDSFGLGPVSIINHSSGEGNLRREQERGLSVCKNHKMQDTQRMVGPSLMGGLGCKEHAERKGMGFIAPFMSLRARAHQRSQMLEGRL